MYNRIKVIAKFRYFCVSMTLSLVTCIIHILNCPRVITSHLKLITETLYLNNQNTENLNMVLKVTIILLLSLPDYNYFDIILVYFGFRYDDLALLELEHDIVYNPAVKPVCLPSSPVEGGTNCVVTGWGSTSGTNIKSKISRYPCDSSPNRRSCPSSIRTVTKPAQVSLLQQGEHAGDSSSLEDSCVCHLILPGDTQDASEATHVEGIEFLVLQNVQGPGLTAIQECAHDAGTVDLDLAVLRQFVVGPHSIGQSGQGGGCLADAIVQLRIEREVVRDG